MQEVAQRPQWLDEELYPFQSRFVEIDGLRIQYVDEGPREADPVLMLHGEPSWSYLYRKMIPIVASAGHRVIPPDLVGFGRSDKPVRREDYIYQRHVAWMRDFIEMLDLQRITVVGQDWGGFIGLRLATGQEERFARIVAANTDLRTGDIPPQEGFPRAIAWRGETVRTAIWKEPVQGRRIVRRLNIDGDRQGDLAGHGGEYRAVFVYQMDSYHYWEHQLGRNDFVFGQFGENFTVDGLSDEEVCIGSALFEVTQPRVTCYRFGIRMNEPQMAALLVSHRKPGFYFRVLQEAMWQLATRY